MPTPSNLNLHNVSLYLSILQQLRMNTNHVDRSHLAVRNSACKYAGRATGRLNYSEAKSDIDNCNSSVSQSTVNYCYLWFVFNPHPTYPGLLQIRLGSPGL